uniref:Elongator complex protein 4 n=1 Tax=Biomphalaria glabrata TaxID=6526 RepID=A0A2C9M3A1_BIOGL
MNVHYCRLLDDIRSRIEAGKFGTAQQTDTRNILRIGIHSIGSPLWGEMGGLKSHGTPDPSLSLFLIALRGVLRSAFAVAMLTLPGHLFHVSF